ncbi:hypothetical protein Pth03_29070 [Planotetraspora thailandica]|uniref:DUF1707 domain-containing protein n=1 Tax=Planotetraspora thailandica TaxID=487172 RepID=A0A8J3V0E0_9ACTN|nr:DUF1707 domain-containing protein [Planotetraspora thailandica]GII54518.1 hypothetical protein Pth03_29070 [Planotetraspora thailandica]
MASRDEIRIGDKERDEVTQALHDAFAQGRITRDELDERLDATLSARTAGDLRRITADLPDETQDPLEHDLPYGMPWPGRGPLAHGPLRGPGAFRGHEAFRVHGPFWGPGHLAPWGSRAAARRPGGPWRRRGGPPVPILAVGALIVLALVTGVAWPLFAAIKIVLIVWLIAAVAGLFHHRRAYGRRHHH